MAKLLGPPAGWSGKLTPCQRPDGLNFPSEATKTADLSKMIDYKRLERGHWKSETPEDLEFGFDLELDLMKWQNVMIYRLPLVPRDHFLKDSEYLEGRELYIEFSEGENENYALTFYCLGNEIARWQLPILYMKVSKVSQNPSSNGWY